MSILRQLDLSTLGLCAGPPDDDDAAPYDAPSSDGACAPYQLRFNTHFHVISAPAAPPARPPTPASLPAADDGAMPASPLRVSVSGFEDSAEEFSDGGERASPPAVLQLSARHTSRQSAAAGAAAAATLSFILPGSTW